MRFLLNLVIFPAFIVGCGGGSSSNPPAPPPSDPAFAAVAPVIEKSCGPCHNDKGQRSFNAANFKSSAAANRIKDGSMPPPPKTLDEGDKEKLLAYLEG